MDIEKYIKLKPHAHGQQKLIVYGRHQGYVLRNGKVSFLTTSRGQCRLDREEKDAIKAWVARHNNEGTDV